MKQFKYILPAFALLLPALINAQSVTNPPIYTNEPDGPYKIENGIATRKTVSTPNSSGVYTLTLETFATGVTSMTNIAIPSDIILVLDLSTSMGGHRGDISRITAPTELSYDEVVNSNNNYVVWYSAHNFGYQLFGLERGGRYYLYWVAPGGDHSGIYFLDQNGNASVFAASTDIDVTHLTAGIPADAAYSTTSDGVICTIPVASGAGLQDLEICKAGSRITELKHAVDEFITEIIDNDLNKDDGTPRAQPLGNRVAIVSFAMDLIGKQYETSMLTLSNSDGTQNTLNVNTLRNTASSLTLKTGTRPDVGLAEANTIFANNPRANKELGRDYSRTIVFFTDGKPDEIDTNAEKALLPSEVPNQNYTGNNRFNPGIIVSKTSKGSTIGATVYSVGLFSGSDATNENIPKFMKLVSSNCPDATSITSTVYDANQDDGVDYYKDASSSEISLADIFKSIAQASGGSERTIPGETKVVDAVSNSFKVADGFQVEDVKVYTRSVNTAGTAWGDPVQLTTIVLSGNGTEDLTPDNIVGVSLSDGTVEVTGFNYSKADSDGANGTTAHPFDGNWVGWRYVNNNPYCAGKELMIQFDIQATDNATGGDLTNTNAPGSGVQIPIFDEDGDVVGYEPATDYPFPRTDLPINLIIEKTGLRHGESATIQIYRAPQSKTEYNKTTGKPAPDLTTPWEEGGNTDKSGWGNFSKVILTNKGADGATVTKTLLCLDAGYVYKLAEDNWGFGYILDDNEIDTSEQEANPFVFNNTLKVTEEDWGGKIIKHAEAVSINHFGTNHRVESYKSSKVDSFTTPSGK